LFPIRPYLSLLVDCLEDTDPHVRECARHSIVELFSGPGVTDAARADLKKELMKKGVRKTIVDVVLSKLLAGSICSKPQSREGSENGEGTNLSKEYIPPSMALLAKKPQAFGQGGGLARTVSQSSFKELQRPTSRAAMASPPPQVPAEILEIQAVYVGHFPEFQVYPIIEIHRWPQVETWKMNLRQCTNRLRYYSSFIKLTRYPTPLYGRRGKRLNITGSYEINPCSVCEAC
jgi:hypothetical protein